MFRTFWGILCNLKGLRLRGTFEYQFQPPCVRSFVRNFIFSERDYFLNEEKHFCVAKIRRNPGFCTFSATIDWIFRATKSGKMEDKSSFSVFACTPILISFHKRDFDIAISSARVPMYTSDMAKYHFSCPGLES